NPISSQICALLFLKPAIEKMLQNNVSFYKKSHAVLGRDLDVNDKKMDYIFATLTQCESKRLTVLPASSQDRFLMSSFSKADCIMVVDKENVKNGDMVEVIRFVCSVLSG
ncbi:hypothetical protein N9W34_06815, partial [Rickettsiales bacterium]|nr:hypothetical protein [Rickettsiales bacterium]